MDSDQNQINMNRSSELLNPGTMEGSVPMAWTSFSTSLMMNTSMPNQEDQSQNYVNTQRFASGAGMHSHLTNQPQFHETYLNLSDIQDINIKDFISSPQTSQPQLNEAYQNQTYQPNSQQSTSGKTLSEDKKGKSKSAIYSANYRKRQNEIKDYGIKLFEYMEQNGQLPALPSHSKMLQIHHPSFSAPEASFPRDRHGTNSGEVEPISIEEIRALEKERDRLATVRRRCIEASTSSPQPNAPLSAQVRESTIPQFHRPNFSAPAVAVDGFQTIFNGSQTSNDIQDPHRRISSSSGGIASSSHITENEENSRAGTSTPMAELMKINETRKSKVNISDFIGLDFEHGERVRVGRYSFPKSLKCMAEKIIGKYGDVTKNSEMPIDVDERIYILFCATIKEMDDHQLQEVTMETILKWSDTIKDALRINFDVEFAMNHLKDNIVPAYIGLIERQVVNNMDLRISELVADLNASTEERDKRHEQSMVYNDAIKKFHGKSVSTGLFK